MHLDQHQFRYHSRQMAAKKALKLSKDTVVELMKQIQRNMKGNLAHEVHIVDVYVKSKCGQWCRFQRDVYKGDLAQVYAIMDQGSRVILRDSGETNPYVIAHSSSPDVGLNLLFKLK
eukprot:198134_1